MLDPFTTLAEEAEPADPDDCARNALPHYEDATLSAAVGFPEVGARAHAVAATWMA